MQSFLQTQISNVNSQQADLNSVAPAGEAESSKPNERFIIVETNFRVYAYTNNKLYKEILKLFVKPVIEFPDMFYGVLTKESVERAYRQKIRTKQIMNFLETHSHREAQYIKQRSRVNQAMSQFAGKQSKGQQDVQMTGAVEKKQSISEKFGLSSFVNQGLYSVTQQLEIWEESMIGFTETEAMMIKLPYSSQIKNDKQKDASQINSNQRS